MGQAPTKKKASASGIGRVERLRPDSAHLPAVPERSSPQPRTEKQKALVSQAGDPKKPEKQKSRVSSLGGLLIGAAASLIVFALLIPSEEFDQKPIRRDSVRIEQLVNKHLVMTNSQIEIEQKKKDLELRERLHELGDTVQPRPLQRPAAGVDMSPDRNELNAINDLRGPSTGLNYHDPSSEIRRQIADKQRKNAEDEAYNKAYREAVAAEARRQGYELLFGPDGQITGAKPLRKPTGSKLGSGTASQ